MLLSDLTIFLSAFLLYKIQPIIAKIILPWYGGSAAVLIIAPCFSYRRRSSWAISVRTDWSASSRRRAKQRSMHCISV
jgi:hypothetical protein